MHCIRNDLRALLYDIVEKPSTMPFEMCVCEGLGSTQMSGGSNPALASGALASVLACLDMIFIVDVQSHHHSTKGLQN